MSNRTTTVLILVLVEHTLGEMLNVENGDVLEVLILVLVEHTLGVFDQFSDNGDSAGLNPCFSGTYSRSYSDDSDSDNINVLILVLVEHTLGGAYAVSAVMKDSVLILVLVEHTLGAG